MGEPEDRIKALKSTLAGYPSYQSIRKKYKKKQLNYYKKGAFSGDKKMAWWSLSKDAKVALDEERRKGRFGGLVGQAPYWTLQEKGKEEVGIPAKRFIYDAVKEWEALLGQEIKQWIGGYSPQEINLGKKYGGE